MLAPARSSNSERRVLARRVPVRCCDPQFCLAISLHDDGELKVFIETIHNRETVAEQRIGEDRTRGDREDREQLLPHAVRESGYDNSFDYGVAIGKHNVELALNGRDLFSRVGNVQVQFFLCSGIADCGPLGLKGREGRLFRINLVPEKLFGKAYLRLIDTPELIRLSAR